MKKLLSLLLCYVFLQTETFALRGGPTNTSGQTVNGSYSGIITETTGSGDIGLFLLTATSSGASNGQFVIFSGSAAGSNSYTGTMSGLSDTSRGGSGAFIGVFSGAPVVSDPSATQSISGAISVKATKVGQNGQRLTGSANSRTLTIYNNTGAGISVAQVVGPLRSYTVDGWQTSGDNSNGFGLSSSGGS